jgi:hypothetical protein
MRFDGSAFLSAWDTAGALLEQDHLVHRWVAESQSSLSRVRRDVERICAGLATVDELFAALHHAFDNPMHGYCALLVLRTLVDLRAQPPTVIEGNLELSYGETQLYAGDLTVSGSVDNRGCLAVLGNLAVARVYTDDEADIKLLVGDTMRARGVWTGGWLRVRGDLLVSDAVIGYYNDRDLAVGGLLQTHVLIEETHGMAWGVLEAQTRPSTDPDGAAVIRRLLVPEVLLPVDDHMPDEEYGEPGMIVDGRAVMELLDQDRDIFLVTDR